jgi:hypothetical protein
MEKLGMPPYKSKKSRPIWSGSDVYQNERENLGIHSGDESEYLILPL